MKNKQRIITLVAVLGFLLITAGVTYAFFSYIGSGTTENTISSDSITFLYEEIDKQGNGISITEATPVDDVTGKQGQAFNFRIISTSASTISIPYEINVRKKDGSDNLDNIVKLYLTKVDDNNQETEVELSKYSDLTTVTKNNHQEKQLHIDKVPANSNGYSQQYRLRMWIDENADFSTGNYNEKTFSVTVNVYSSGHVETDADRQAASRTDVTSLSVNNTVLTGNNNLYETRLSTGTTQATIDLVTTNPYTKAVIEKTDSTYTNVIAMNTGIQRLSTSKVVSLTTGYNYFRIRLTSEDGTTNSELHLKIKVSQSATLTGMAKLIYDSQSEVLEDPTLTVSSSNAHENGFYSYDVSDGYANGYEGNTYYFRGNVNNNYVRFANMDWRVVRINEDGTTRIILDDSIDQTNYRYNDSYSDYTSMYYTNSSVKSVIDTWYQTNIVNAGYGNYVATGNYFCEAGVALVTGTWTSVGSATMVNYPSYTPNFKCITDGNGKGIVSEPVGLLTYDELTFAGARRSYDNKEYYLYKNYYWYTMSPAGVDGSSTPIWIVDDDGDLGGNTSHKSNRLRPVINLKADTTATKQVIDGKTYYVVN